MKWHEGEERASGRAAAAAASLTGPWLAPAPVPGPPGRLAAGRGARAAFHRPEAERLGQLRRHGWPEAPLPGQCVALPVSPVNWPLGLRKRSKKAGPECARMERRAGLQRAQLAMCMASLFRE